MNMKQVIMGCGVVLVLAGGGYFVINSQDTPPEINTPGVRVFNQPVSIPNFTLHDHKGGVFNEARFEDKWSILFFGFTNCPDICPATMSLMNVVAKKLEKRPGGLDDVQFVFVSVDPFRDDVAKLDDFVSYFNNSFIGATGEKDELDRLALELGGIYDFEDVKTHDLIRDVTQLDKGAEYLVTHFAALMVIDPKVRLVAHILPPHKVEKTIETFNTLRGL
ncbi:MAG: SCO family protein [Gammaproteobacteria bacterium]|nr:SCO family protein [Gammaproteobacteria bacterium]